MSSLTLRPTAPCLPARGLAMKTWSKERRTIQAKKKNREQNTHTRTRARTHTPQLFVFSHQVTCCTNASELEHAAPRRVCILNFLRLHANLRDVRLLLLPKIKTTIMRLMRVIDPKPRKHPSNSCELCSSHQSRAWHRRRVRKLFSVASGYLRSAAFRSPAGVAQ